MKLDQIEYDMTFSDNRKHCTIEGKVFEQVRNSKIGYIAACPPHINGSYSGSGLPYANQVMAFDDTPNKGIAKVSKHDGRFKISFYVPSAYYLNLGSILVPPTLYIEYNNGQKNKRISIKIDEEIPYRTLTYHKTNDNVNFYNYIWSQPVRDQERILRDSQYPLLTKGNKPIRNHSEFWGLKPSL